MNIIADLHSHSKYAQAVSKYMDLSGISTWCKRKGINLVTPGDFTHPIWFKELNENLVETSSGIYSFKDSIDSVKFLLTTEVACVYTQNGKGRRLHLLIFSPALEVCAKINLKLASLGFNLKSDGRPILGISAKALLEILLEIDENILLIPAHIWTPWFGLLGSKSGFDSIGECFGNLSKYIYGFETGLSSDPAMNWSLSEMKDRSILSFSDAHSPQKLGRELTVFESEKVDFTYIDICDAIKNKSSIVRLSHTIEFFPEEGKYHSSGHRNCNVVYSSEEVKKLGNICPICNKKFTEGVSVRISNLSKFQKGLEELHNGITFTHDKDRLYKPFISLIPLQEILEELMKSKTKASREYLRITDIFSEMDILINLSQSELDKLNPSLSLAIQKLRKRQVYVEPGYDGVFGSIKLFNSQQSQ